MSIIKHCFNSKIYKNKNHLSKCAYSIDTNYAFAKLGGYSQDPPCLYNPYATDPILQNYLKFHLPKDEFKSVDEDLYRFGDRIISEIDEMGAECEAQQPRLEQFDAYGRRVDKLITCPSWRGMHRLAAKEGLVAIAYERPHFEWSRLHQMAKTFLYGPSSGLYGCPLAMTDGAAKIIENLGKPDLLKQAFNRLTSRDPDLFWTSGQWMTERRGGSDVGEATDTIAIAQSDGTYCLHGYKWFSSATDASMTMTLARVADENGNVVKNGKGLSLFYLETRDPNGGLDSGLNGIQMVKLKNKLGTRQLPTAELLLDGARAHMVSEEGRGVSAISGMLLITRLHTAAQAVSGMRRLCQVARDYAGRRKAFGRLLVEHPLHMRTLAQMEIECRAGSLLFLEVARLLGLADVHKITEEDKELLRILSPLVKLYTAKQSVSVISEGLEAIGGLGYIEDTGLPGLLRDVQVATIWEGTTNVLSLDVLRAIKRSKGSALSTLLSVVVKRSAAAASACSGLLPLASVLQQHVTGLQESLPTMITAEGDLVTLMARDLAFSLSRIYMGMLLIEYATFATSTEADIFVAQRWIYGQDLCPVLSKHSNLNQFTTQSIKYDLDIVMAAYDSSGSSRSL